MATSMVGSARADTHEGMMLKIIKGSHSKDRFQLQEMRLDMGRGFRYESL